MQAVIVGLDPGGGANGMIPFSGSLFLKRGKSGFSVALWARK
jgi:hypothetical protein